MKRLYSYLEDTFPFINDDFNNVLQDQHMIAYSAYLDGINDEKYSTYSTNRGISLSGIDVTATPNQSATDRFDWQVKIGPSSLVYFDGQYYNPDPTFTNGDLEDITLSFKGYCCLFIYPFTQSISRQFKNDQLGTQSFSIDYRFNIIPHLYPSSVTALIPQYPGKTMGVPYILYEFGGTSRNLSRLLKLSTTVKDDIQITYNPKSWTVPTNNWQIYQDGYVYRDFETKTQSTFTGFKMGRNELKGFAVLDDMGGRFMVGYDSTSSPTPSNAGLLEFNYKTPTNKGGTQSLTFSIDQIAEHTHGELLSSGPGQGTYISSKTDPPVEDLDHSHYFKTGFVQEDSFSGPITTLPEPSGIAYGIPSQPEEIFLTRSTPYFDQEVYDMIGSSQEAGKELYFYDKADYRSNYHWHQINSAGLNRKHENRPPYMVTLFYYKL